MKVFNTLPRMSSLHGPIWIVAGNGIAALIAILALPFLARVMEPATIGVYQAFVAVALIIGAVSCLRYETDMFTVFGKINPEEATGRTLVVGGVVTVLVTIVVLLSPVHFRQEYTWFTMLPIATFSQSIGIIGRSKALVEERFVILFYTTIVGAIATFFLPVMLVVMVPSIENLYALLGGFILGRLVFLIPLLIGARIQFRGALRGVLQTFHIPRDLLPLTLLSNFSIQLPVLFLITLSEQEYLAAYYFAMQILNAPISLLAQPISQYIMSRAYDQSGFLGYRALLRILSVMMISVSVFYGLIVMASFLNLTTLFGELAKSVAVVLLVAAFGKLLQAFNAPFAAILSLNRHKKKYGAIIVLAFIPLRWLLFSMFGADFEGFVIGLTVGLIAFYGTYSLVAFLISMKDEV